MGDISVWDKLKIIANHGYGGLQYLAIMDIINKVGKSYSGQQGVAVPRRGKHWAPVEEVNVRPRVTEANVQGLLGHHLDKDIVGVQ